MNTFAVPCSDDVTPQDIAAIEKVLQHIDHQNLKKAVLGPLANWFLALKIFKEIEIRYALMSDRTTIEQPHRAVLAGLLGNSSQIYQRPVSILHRELNPDHLVRIFSQIHLQHQLEDIISQLPRRHPPQKPSRFLQPDGCPGRRTIAHTSSSGTSRKQQRLVWKPRCFSDPDP